jgi:hypothetical protein
VGDIWYGHPEKRTLGTHQWDGLAWHELPNEVESVLILLADARTRIAALEAEVARKDEALRKVMPISVEDGPDYASVYFGDGSTHSTKAMTMNPQDWLDISAALEARNG